MRKTSLFFVVFVCASTFSGSALAHSTKNTLPPTSELLTQVSYGAVTQLKYAVADEVISYGDSKQQFIEGWLPKGNPVADIVFIHGGCWLSAYDIEHSRALTAALRDQGYRVWSLEYRRSGDDNPEDEGGWPETYTDVDSALNLLTKQNKIEPTRTVLMGHSAGGHLALLAAQNNVNYAGVVGLAAIADVVAYAKGSNSCQSVTEQFMGDTPENMPEEYEKANPKTRTMHKNTILIYSEQDSIVPASQVEDLQNVTRLKVDNAGHFDFIHPGSTSFKVILDAVERSLN